MQYYGNRISENISRREPEGYLLCLNVPVARTGMQEYLPEELGVTAKEPNPIRLSNAGSTGACARYGQGRMIPVYRPEEEVFAPETMASFEAVPVTNDHPVDGVDLDNIRRLQAGHAQNVRRGSGKEADLLLADLVITDERLIEAILNGKREISCGYTYELAEENGRYIQRKIRGNHIAVVEAGRAGARVSIKDHAGFRGKAPEAQVSIKDHMGSKGKAPGAPFPVQGNKQFERRKDFMKKGLGKILARMAKDGDVETVAEFIEEMIGESTPAEEVAVEETAVTTAEVAAAVNNGTAGAIANEKKEVLADEESAAGIIERLDRIIELLSLVPAGDEEPGDEGTMAEEIAEVVEEIVEAAETDGDVAESEAGEVAEMVENILETEISTTLEEDEEEECETPEETVTQDALRAALTAVRPALSRMSRKQRQKVCADIAGRLYSNRKASDGNAYVALTRASRRRPGNPMDLGKRIMAARNANYHK